MVSSVAICLCLTCIQRTKMNTETAGNIAWTEVNLENFNCIAITKEFPHWTDILNTPSSANKGPIKKIKYFKSEM